MMKPFVWVVMLLFWLGGVSQAADNPFALKPNMQSLENDVNDLIGDLKSLQSDDDLDDDLDDEGDDEEDEDAAEPEASPQPAAPEEAEHPMNESPQAESTDETSNEEQSKPAPQASEETPKQA